MTTRSVPIREEDVHALIELAKAYRNNGGSQWYNSAKSILGIVVVLVAGLFYLYDTRNRADDALKEVASANVKIEQSAVVLDNRITGVKADLEKRIDRENGDIVDRLDRIERHLLKLVGDTNGPGRPSTSTDGGPQGAPVEPSQLDDHHAGQYTGASAGSVARDRISWPSLALHRNSGRAGRAGGHAG